MYLIMFYEAPLPQHLNCRTVSGSELFEGIPLGGDTICVSCHNGIVHSHQLCSAENAFTYTFKDFCRPRYMLHLIL